MSQNAVAPIESLKRQLTTAGNEFRAALPSHITPEKFQRVVVTACNTQPKLLTANRLSLLNACTKAAQDGLLPDGREGALVIYSTKVDGAWVDAVQWQPMVAGLLKKARNSGLIKTIAARCIFQHDSFDYWVDDQGEHIEHKPVLFGNRGPLIGAYALATLKDESVYIAVLSKEKIDQHQRASKSKDKDGNPTGPWRDWYEEMAEKTAIRVLSKRLPSSSDRDDEFRDALNRDDEAPVIGNVEGETIDGTTGEVVTQTRRRPTRLQQVVDAKVVDAEPAGEPERRDDADDGADDGKPSDMI